MTEIYEMGESVPLGKINELRDHILTVIGKYKAITLSGSLPPGVPSDFYADLINMARKENILTFLDTSGDALRKGAESRPFLIKPNETEAKSLLGLRSSGPFDSAQAAAEISTRYGTDVLLSLGSKGAVVAKAEEIFKVKSPSVEAKSAVGSGDCMLAGLTHEFCMSFRLKSPSAVVLQPEPPTH